MNTILKWYAVQSFSGFEDRAKTLLKKEIEEYSLEDKFGEIIIPTELIARVKDGKRFVKNKKSLPGYMLVQMEYNKETGYLIKQSPKIIGFVGRGIIPRALDEFEIKRLRKLAHSGVKGNIEKSGNIEYKIEDLITVIDGSFLGYNGHIKEINSDKKKLKIFVSMFNRLILVELNYIQVKRIT